MQTITFQFSTSAGIGSALIRWRTCSPVSHVDLVTPSGALIGARMDGGVMSRPQNYCTFTRRIRVTIPVTDQQYDKFWAFARAQLGKPYDKTAILGLLLHRDWREDSEWFCSEYAGSAVEAAGICRIDTQKNWVAPELLRVVLCALPGSTEIDVTEAMAAKAGR